MPSRSRISVAAACMAGGLFGLASVTHVLANEEFIDPSPNTDQPVPLIQGRPAPADVDELVHHGPSGEHDPRVGALLAAHPDRDVLICLAGCGGQGPKIVTVRQTAAAIAVRNPSPVSAGQFRPSSGEVNSSVANGPPAAAPLAMDAAPAVGDVICLAGCEGAPGEVVQKAVRLTWIDQGANAELQAALRGLADRLIAKDAEAAAETARAGTTERLAWMPDGARRELVAPTLSPVLAALVRSAAVMADRSSR